MTPHHASVSMTGWTFGVELEWPDVPAHYPLPHHWTWSDQDYTIVNSSGIAADPRGTLVTEGGELNSPPYLSLHQLADDTKNLTRLLQPGHNYRSNLHIHIRIPGLDDHLPALLAIATYSRTHMPHLWHVVDPLDGLLATQPGAVQQQAARKRLAHSQRSRHHFTTSVRHQARHTCTSLQALLACEVPVGRNGQPAWALAPREAVNLRALRKHGTIEFRCFAAPTSAQQVYAAAAFARDWIAAALTDADPRQVAEQWAPHLPRQHAFEHRLELGWQWTNLHNNSRRVVAERLTELGYRPQPATPLCAPATSPARPR